MNENNFFKKAIQFTFSSLFVRNLLFSFVVGGIIIFVLLVFLKVFTKHGAAYSVPNFSGLTIEEAEELADDKDLRMQIVDSVYNAPGKPGTVVEQNPPKDFKVKDNRRIFLTIKAINPELISMPDFVNSTLIQAKSDIETYGMRIGKLLYKPWKYDNVVIEQKFNGKPIAPGTSIEKGSKIDLILGKSDGFSNTQVPSLLGLSRIQAEMKAAELMLNIGSVLYDGTVISYADTINAAIVKQFPQKDVTLVPGGEIDIWLSMKNDTTQDEEDEEDN